MPPVQQGIGTDLRSIRSWQRNYRWRRELRFLPDRNGFTDFRNRSRSRSRSRSRRDRSRQAGRFVDGGGWDKSDWSDQARRPGDGRGLRDSRGSHGRGSGVKHETTLKTDQLQGWFNFAGEELSSSQGRFGSWSWRINVGLEGVGLYASGETVVFY